MIVDFVLFYELFHLMLPKHSNKLKTSIDAMKWKLAWKSLCKMRRRRVLEIFLLCCFFLVEMKRRNKYKRKDIHEAWNINNSILFRNHFRLYKRVKFNDEAGEDYSLSEVKDIKGITPTFRFSTYCQNNFYSRRVPLDTGQCKGQVLDRAV